MTYPFAGEIKMNKIIKDGQEVIEWEQVDMSKHVEGNLGIGDGQMKLDGVIWDASAPLIMGEPVERMRISMTDGVGITPGQELTAFSFAAPSKEWARIDKDMNVTHLDMDLCAEGPQNAYTALAIAIWNKAIKTEREACAKVCESEWSNVAERMYGEECAAAIRARSGEQK